MGALNERLYERLRQDDRKMRRSTVFHVVMACLTAEALIALIAVLYR